MTRPIEKIKQLYSNTTCEWCKGNVSGWQCKNPQVKIKRQRICTEYCTPEQWATECPLNANKA